MIRAGLLVVLVLFATAHADPSGPSDLYYVVESPASHPNTFEIRILGGNDFSNPYLDTITAGLSAHWLLHRTIGLGLEAVTYRNSKRSSAIALEQTLGPFGFQVETPSPEWSSAAVIRLVPMTGLVNFFSWKIVPIDVIVLGKAGLSRYSAYNPGLLLGVGLEMNIGFDSMWGMFLAASWEQDHIPTLTHQSRVGFRAGPRVRF